MIHPIIKMKGKISPNPKITKREIIVDLGACQSSRKRIISITKGPFDCFVKKASADNSPALNQSSFGYFDRSAKYRHTRANKHKSNVV
jgi:hypothetical protein